MHPWRPCRAGSAARRRRMHEERDQARVDRLRWVPGQRQRAVDRLRGDKWVVGDFTDTVCCEWDVLPRKQPAVLQELLDLGERALPPKARPSDGSERGRPAGMVTDVTLRNGCATVRAKAHQH